MNDCTKRSRQPETALVHVPSIFHSLFILCAAKKCSSLYLLLRCFHLQRRFSSLLLFRKCFLFLTHTQKNCRYAAACNIYVGMTRIGRDIFAPTKTNCTKTSKKQPKNHSYAITMTLHESPTSKHFFCFATFTIRQARIGTKHFCFTLIHATMVSHLWESHQNFSQTILQIDLFTTKSTDASGTHVDSWSVGLQPRIGVHFRTVVAYHSNERKFQSSSFSIECR